jgi:hypothetical protein
VANLTAKTKNRDPGSLAFGVVCNLSTQTVDKSDSLAEKPRLEV